jgi:hypothetical protein
VVNSIVEGSVLVDMLITSYNDAGSSGAIGDENKLTALLNSGTVGNMPVSTYRLVTNGGSNNIPSNGDSNNDSSPADRGQLSTTVTIVLAVTIPVAIFGKL